MVRKNCFITKKMNAKVCLFAVIMLVTVFSTACGQGRSPEDKGNALSEIGTSVSEEGKTAGETDGILTPESELTGQTGNSTGQAGSSTGQTGNSTGTLADAPVENDLKLSVDAARQENMQKLFGDYCIVGQTFEVELSEYDGKVWFVPFAPSADNQDFRMEIVQNGEVLKEIIAYVPEHLAKEEFSSLDAVAFFDINYDGSTDILLIQTYGNTTFAAVYYGQNDGYGVYFLPEPYLSENISNIVEPLTVPNIRVFLSDGKKNGEFSNYQEAYRAVGRQYELDNSNERRYDLIYIDDDDIPELVAAVNGYYVSLYTFSDGKVYTLMDDWGYGAMGNSGYAYVPEKNSLRNYNTDYAGAILYTTYMEVGTQKAIEVSVEIVTYNFDDVNGNGIPDENEESSLLGDYSVSYIDGKEITGEELRSYDKGEYEYIEGRMSFDELLGKLKVN